MIRLGPWQDCGRPYPVIHYYNVILAQTRIAAPCLPMPSPCNGDGRFGHDKKGRHDIERPFANCFGQ